MPSEVYLQITAVDTGVTRRIEPVGINLREVGNDAALLDFEVVEGIDTFLQSFAPESQVLLLRNQQCEFRGELKVLEDRAVAGKLFLHCQALCKLTWLDGVMAGRDGDHICQWNSPIIRFAGIPLVRLTATSRAEFADDSTYNFFPASSQMTNTHSAVSPWIARDNSRSSTLVNPMASGNDLTPVKVADYTQFRAPGFAHIDDASDEVIWFGTVYPDPAFDGTGYLGDIIRDVQGSTNDAHAAGAAIYQRELKCIAQVGVQEVRYTVSGDTISGSDYDCKHIDGRFDFTVLPSAAIEADYAVYDMDASDKMTVGEALTDILQMPAPTGLALTSGQIDLSALDTIAVHRIAVENLTLARPMINRILDDFAPHGNPATKFVQFDYDPQADVYRAVSVTQKTNPDFTFDVALEVNRRRSANDFYSGVVARYWTNIISKLTSSERTYHLDIGDQASHATPGSTNTQVVTKSYYMLADEANGTGWISTTTAGNSVRTNLMFDNNPGTGWGIGFGGAFWTGGEPATNLLFMWFPADMVVDYVKLVLDARQGVDDDYFVELVGYDAYTPGDPPTLGNVVELPGHLAYMIHKNNGTTLGPPKTWIRNVPTSPMEREENYG